MKRQPPTFITGFRPVIHAREGKMLGSRNPLDGPVFAKLQDAIDFCMHIMTNHFDRGLGISDAQIERFEGMV